MRYIDNEDAYKDLDELRAHINKINANIAQFKVLIDKNNKTPKERNQMVSLWRWVYSTMNFAMPYLLDDDLWGMCCELKRDFGDF